MIVGEATTTAEAVAQFEAQGALVPPTLGWWKVWGAQVRHIQPGDLVATLVDGDLAWDLVRDTFTAKSAPLREGFITDEGRFTLGALVPIVLMRWGTHHMLAE